MRISDWSSDVCSSDLADAKVKGSGNFVEDIAAELPLQAIAELMGVPQEDRGKLFEWSNQMLSYDDPEIEGDEEAASIEILTYAAALADERRKNPKDDIVTKLLTADRSEEHTSELQSLMRITYAVYCLKQKKR